MFGFASKKEVEDLKQSVENLLEVSRRNREDIELLVDYFKLKKNASLSFGISRDIYDSAFHLIPNSFIDKEDSDRNKINLICKHLGIDLKVKKQNELVIVKKEEVKEEK